MQNASIAQQLHAVHRSFDVFGKNAGNCKSRPTYDTVETCLCSGVWSGHLRAVHFQTSSR